MTLAPPPPVVRWLGAFRRRGGSPWEAAAYELDRDPGDVVSAEPVTSAGPRVPGASRDMVGLRVAQDRARMVAGWDHDVWSDTTADREDLLEQARAAEREHAAALAAVDNWRAGRRAPADWVRIGWRDVAGHRYARMGPEPVRSWSEARALEERAYDALARARELYAAAHGHDREQPQARTWDEVARLRIRRHEHGEVLCSPVYDAVVLRTCGRQVGRMAWLGEWRQWAREHGLALVLLDDSGRERVALQ